MSHAEAIERYWRPDAGRSYQEVFDQFPRTSDAYNDPGQPLVVACIDEGMPRGKNVAFIAGSGVLEEPSVIDPVLGANNIDGMTSHAGCGAAALAAQGAGFPGNPDEFGDRFSQEKAHALGVPYDGRITPTDMTRPPDFHVADTFYLDGTGQGFNPNLVNGAPVGFVHSRGIFGDPEMGQRQVALGINIAMGAHGFGDRFTSEHPFNVVVITDSRPGSVPLDTLLTEARTVASGNPRVRVHSVTLKERPRPQSRPV